MPEAAHHTPPHKRPSRAVPAPLSAPLSWYYADARPHIVTGHAIGFTDNRPLSHLIRWRTGGPISHAALCVRIEDYCAERVFLVEALSRGLTFTSLSDRLREYREHGGKAYWIRPPLPFGEEARVAAICRMGEYAMEQLGARVKYDYKSLVRNLFRRQRADDEIQFCSEFVWRAWQAGGLDVPDKDGLAPTPADLLSWWPEVKTNQLVLR